MKIFEMKKMLILTVFIFSALGLLNAQSSDGIYNNEDEASVNSLLMLHKEFTSNYSSISGYRIQIFKGSGNNALDNAETLMDEFSEEYEDIIAYISFMEPYYRVRVGDYRTRLDALNALRLIKKVYASAFVIKEDIELVVLPKYQNINSYEQEDNSGS